MGCRDKMIGVCVSERQRDFVRDKAREYGISVSRLILRSVEAYTRVYDGDAGECALVAVNYGVWTRALVALTGVEGALRECAQQLAGLRRMLAALAGEGGLRQADVTRVEGVLLACLADIREARKRTEGGVEVLETLHGAACVTDFTFTTEPPFFPSGRKEG